MNNFYIVANTDKDAGFFLTKQICAYLEKHQKNCTYQEFDHDNSGSLYNYAEAKKVPEGTECVIVLGGDGTLIQAARDLSGLEIPVLGINIGTLGYLTEIDREQIFPAIDLLLRDKYEVDERMMLRGTVYRDETPVYSEIALNDIVINRIGPLRVIHFDIFVNGEFLISYPADGLIVATPTGSTAYNLSAGGPIVQPKTRMIVMTPVCPHVLNKSSVVFDGTDVLEILMSPSRDGVEERVVTFDGTKYFPLLSKDRIVIERCDKTARFVRTGKHNFLQILRNKLA